MHGLKVQILRRISMTTPSSLDMEYMNDPCFAAWSDISGEAGCACLTIPDAHCGTSACPFYKPAQLSDWVRVEDNDGINLMPPEEYEDRMMKRLRPW